MIENDQQQNQQNSNVFCVLDATRLRVKQYCFQLNKIDSTGQYSVNKQRVETMKPLFCT